MYLNRSAHDWSLDLGSKDPDRRADAARALVEIGSLSREILAELPQLVSDPDERVRRLAAAALAFDPLPSAATLEALEGLLSDPNDYVRSRAAKSLRELGEPGVAALIECVARGAGAARLTACVALNELKPGQQLARAVPVLAEVTRDADAELATASARVLGSLGGAAALALPVLVEALAGRPELRDAVIQALAGIGLPAVSAVLAGLERGDEWAIESGDAILRWVEWEAQDPAAAAALVGSALDSHDARVRLRAIQFVEVDQVRDAALTVAVERLAADPDPRVRAAVKRLRSRTATKASGDDGPDDARLLR